MYLSGHGAAANTLVSTLSPRPDDPAVAVQGKTPHRSPWRVLMIADHPGRLVESNLVANLATPLQLKDTSWITPGRSAWDRWWSGDWAPGADFKVAMNTATMKYFTDLAAEMGWEYVLVDWGWYGPITDFETGGERDCTKPVAAVDVPEIVRYAKAKNVKVLLWIFWTHLDQRLDEALALYEKWGVAGIKVDFMARDDQWMVNWYETVVRKAAEHHLTVDFHGAMKPTGLERAYPNNLTREGVLGNEYNKWSDRVTPEHKVTLPFTRMLAGPMDFTPGGFRHATKAGFKAQDSQPMVMGTRAAELALLVVYESPLQVICDSPDAYRGQVGTSFLKETPATWDETRVLAGEVGQLHRRGAALRQALVRGCDHRQRGPDARHPPRFPRRRRPVEGADRGRRARGVGEPRAGDRGHVDGPPDRQADRAHGPRRRLRRDPGARGAVDQIGTPAWIRRGWRRCAMSRRDADPSRQCQSPRGRRMRPTLMARAAGESFIGQRRPPDAVEGLEGARHRRRRGHEADLADALRAERALRLGLLDEDDLGLRHVAGAQDAELAQARRSPASRSRRAAPR